MWYYACTLVILLRIFYSEKKKKEKKRKEQRKKKHLYQLSIWHKWLKNEANKTSSVVGYHIEMPANARLRSSGFVAFFFFVSFGGAPRRVRKISPIAAYQVSRDRRRETIVKEKE
jgi:hypothetical protein